MVFEEMAGILFKKVVLKFEIFKSKVDVFFFEFINCRTPLSQLLFLQVHGLMQTVRINIYWLLASSETSLSCSK